MELFEIVLISLLLNSIVIELFRQINMTHADYRYAKEEEDSRMRKRDELAEIQICKQEE